MNNATTNNNNRSLGSISRARTPRRAYPPYTLQHPGSHSDLVHVQQHEQNMSAVHMASGSGMRAELQSLPSSLSNIEIPNDWRPSEELGPMAMDWEMQVYEDPGSVLQYDASVQNLFAHQSPSPLPHIQPFQEPADSVNWNSPFMPTDMPSMSGWEAPFAQNAWQPYGGPPLIRVSVPDAQLQTSAPSAPSEDRLTWDVLSSFGELGLTATPPSSPHPYLATPPPPSASSISSYSAAPARQTSFGSLESDSLSAYNYDSSWSSMPIDDRAIESFSPNIAPIALPPSPSPIIASNASLTTYDPSKPAPCTNESSQAMLTTDASAATGVAPSTAATSRLPGARAPAPRVPATRSPNFGHRTPRFRTREQWASVHLDEYGVFIPPKKCSDGKWMCACGTKMKSVASIRERHGSYKERYGCSKPECGVSFARRDARVRHECLMHDMHADCKAGISRCSRALSQPPRIRPAHGLAARAQ